MEKSQSQESSCVGNDSASFASDTERQFKWTLVLEYHYQPIKEKKVSNGIILKTRNQINKKKQGSRGGGDKTTATPSSSSSSKGPRERERTRRTDRRTDDSDGQSLPVVHKQVFGEGFGKGVGVGSRLHQTGRDVLQKLVIQPLRQLDEAPGVDRGGVQLLVHLGQVAVPVGCRHVHQGLRKQGNQWYYHNTRGGMPVIGIITILKEGNSLIGIIIILKGGLSDIGIIIILKGGMSVIGTITIQNGGRSIIAILKGGLSVIGIIIIWEV